VSPVGDLLALQSVLYFFFGACEHLFGNRRGIQLVKICSVDVERFSVGRPCGKECQLGMVCGLCRVADCGGVYRYIMSCAAVRRITLEKVCFV